MLTYTTCNDSVMLAPATEETDRQQKVPSHEQMQRHSLARQACHAESKAGQICSCCCGLAVNLTCIHSRAQMQYSLCHWRLSTGWHCWTWIELHTALLHVVSAVCWFPVANTDTRMPAGSGHKEPTCHRRRNQLRWICMQNCLSLFGARMTHHQSRQTPG